MAAKTVDEYIKNAKQYQDELVKLRKILNGCGLEEGIKWGAPCYMVGGKNVVGIGCFKSYCGLWFYRGAELSDPDGVLINAQEGKTSHLRQWRFTDGKQIKVRPIKAYVQEAIELEQTSKAPAPKKPSSRVVVPEELQKALSKSKQAQSAFDAMTPGKRRLYCEHIAEAKRAETKAKRIEKIIPMIKEGVGLHDKYKNC